MTAQEREIVRCVSPYTMTNEERIVALCRAVEHVVTAEVPGDFVECGVWRGGSVMAMALRLQQLGIENRTLWLYDTFNGMTPPEDVDVDFTGHAAAATLARHPRESSVWAVADRREVAQALDETRYPRLRYVCGSVEETLPATRPHTIALLRLDTDWYRSTYHELQHLYPLLSPGGVLIVDDYGHWRGAQAAVDRYMEEQHLSLVLYAIDYSAYMAVNEPSGACS